jgi:hypothetical protein
LIDRNVNFYMRRPLVLLALVGLVGTLFIPASAAADPLSAWTPGPNAILDNTYQGYIDSPAMNATVPNGNFTVSGWFVDTQADGWAGADNVQVWLGTMDGPRESNGISLGNATLGFSDATALVQYGSQFANAGWRFDVKPTQFHQGDHNLYIYAHSVVTGKENLVTLGLAVVEDT